MCLQEEFDQGFELFLLEMQALWLYAPLNQHVDTMLDLVALLGVTLAFLSVVFW